MTSPCQILIILIYCIGLNLSQTQECSAIDAYLQIIYQPFSVQTVLSSQALFAPETYRIEPTEIVLLESSDDPCDEFSIDTIINDTIVLLNSSEECSPQSQVLALERNGAAAVLFASIDNVVTPIPGSPNIDTTIPARQIRKSMAETIVERIKAAQNGIYSIF